MLSFFLYDIHIYLAWVVGIYTFVHSVCLIAQCLIRNFIRQPLDLQQRYGKSTWALVTGANGGVGEEYCVQLAKKGFNIILCGRNKQGIEKVEEKIRKSSPQVQTKTLIADLGDSLSPNYYQDFFNRVKDLDISILINNAGVNSIEYFGDISMSEHLKRARVNMGAPTMICKLFIEKFLTRSKKSAIINVSSLGQNFALPCVGDYNSSKKFLSLFSYHLQDNYGDRLDIQDLMPGYVTTKLVDYYDGPDAITPEECARKSLRDLGQEFSSVPTISHSASGQIAHVLYRFIKPLYRSLIVGEADKMALKGFYERTKKHIERQVHN